MRCILCVVCLLLCYSGNAADDWRIENVSAFARLYGYVRFFHPSDEVQSVDWDRVALRGIEHVLVAREPAELRTALLSLFEPIAPTLQIWIGDREPPRPLVSADESARRVVAWQHFGVRLSDRSNIYQSIRVGGGSTESLFATMPQIGETTEAAIGRGLVVRVPLALYATERGTQGSRPEAFADLNGNLGTISLEYRSANELNVRLANIVIAWNVFQHFYPYFDVVEVDWPSVLEESTAAAFDALDADAFADVLRLMLVQLHDGHGNVNYTPAAPQGRPPFAIELAEGQVVIAAIAPGAGVAVGDQILRVDDRPALQELGRLRSLISGSPQLREYRALNMFGVGDGNAPVRVTFLRGDGSTAVRELQRSAMASPYYPARPPFIYEAINELREGIYVVNLAAIDKETLDANAEQLASAESVILDARLGANLQVVFDEILPHLTDSAVQSPQWLVPQVVYPDRRNLRFSATDWSRQPQAPLWSGRIVVLIGSHVISSGETFLGFLDHYGLAETVGDTTAGTNGNVNFIPLIGGFDIMWTGMKVLHQDGSQHHLVGYQPQHPVTRTIQGIREGRDEVLERAIELVSSN